jgi:hypothetical protein
MRRALDPRISNVAIDANSLDRPDPARAAAVDRLLGLYEAEKVRLIVPKGVRIEFQHGRTPGHVKDVGLSQIFTLPVGLNEEEQRKRREVELELQGNARPGKHAPDADHLFEAAKHCAYFITHDQRILDRAGKLRDVLPPSLTVLTLAEFLQIFDDFEAGRRL